MANLSKRNLAESVAEQTGLSLNKANQVVTTVFNTVAEAMKNGDTVEILGFGKFYKKEVSARTAMNLATKEKIQVPAHGAPAFKASKGLKDSVR